jgi:hypothetical protein
VNSELFVSSKNFASRSVSRPMNSAAPGMGAAPRINTPSMSIK